MMVRIFALAWGNLETKYWGELIGDGVQLRKKQVTWTNLMTGQEWLGKNNGKTNDLMESYHEKPKAPAKIKNTKAHQNPQTWQSERPLPGLPLAKVQEEASPPWLPLKQT